jgi:hypothetical protein
MIAISCPCGQENECSAFVKKWLPGLIRVAFKDQVLQ